MIDFHVSFPPLLQRMLQLTRMVPKALGCCGASGNPCKYDSRPEEQG